MRSQEKRTIVLAVAAILVGNSYGFSQQVVHDARGFECGFIYDKTKRGKSGDASCSYTGERVFGIAHSLPPWEHCKTEQVFDFKDVKLRIDFEANNVVWEQQEGLAPFAIPQMIDYYMREEHIGREEAARKVNKPPPPWKQIPLTYEIFHVYKGEAFVSSDPITQTLPKEPKYMPVYTVTFGTNYKLPGNDLYSLFIPDNGIDGNAIMSHYVADGSDSWISMRFGKCRALK